MNDVHGSHALIETLAALVLSLGGAAILVRAWLARRAGSTVRKRPGWSVAGQPSDASAPALAIPVLVGLLSAAAGAIHLVAAPEHVEMLGDLGLGFYWAALFQVGFAAAWIASSRSTRLAWLGLIGNAFLIAAWAWSRTVGLPGLADGPEPIGAADGVAVALELGIVVLLAAEARIVPPSRLVQPSHGLGAAALVAIGGVAVLATVIALVDLAGGGHHGADRPPHAASHSAP